jgi:hypothetical protein
MSKHETGPPVTTEKAKTSKEVISAKLTSRQRHERDCKVCRHANRVEIEREWIGWGDTTRIAKAYRLTRDSLYRHAHARGLFAKRQRNARQALERIIEKAETVHVNAASVVAAVQAYAKINAHGQWIDRSESVNLNELFDRMTRDELDVYAREGKLPNWFENSVGATGFEAAEESESG